MESWRPVLSEGRGQTTGAAVEEGHGQVFERLLAVLALLVDAGLDLEADVAELVGEVGDSVPRAGVVPDDGATERLAGLATPSDGGLALVRDACRRVTSLSHGQR